MKPYYEDKYCKIYHADCQNLDLSALDIGMIFTDPPYGIDANKQTLGKGKRDFHRGGNWDSFAPVDFIRKLHEVGTEMVVWGGNYFTDALPPTNDWLIWHKRNDGRSFSECEMAWTNIGCNTRHISHHWSGEEKLHPTAKPIQVVSWAMGKSRTHGAVLDPFMGSGTTLRVAKDMNRMAIGFEIEEAYCEIAAKRLEQEVLAFY